MSGLCPLFLFLSLCRRSIRKEIRFGALLEPLVESHGMELIYAECLRMPSRWVVRLFLDKEGGIFPG